MSFLAIKDVTKTFGKFTALKDICFDVDEGEFVCLVGPSGCGKTTLLRIIAGLEEPDIGSSVLMRNKDITDYPPSKRDFGIVFQSYALFPNMTAAQNIAYGLKNNKFNKNEIKEKVNESLALVNLERIQNYYPSQMSGGQQQRIALARALALSPSFLLLDEPLSALDAKVRVMLRMEMRRLQERLGITTIMVTHDQEEALTMGDRIIVMNEAVIEQIGTPTEVYEQPKTPFVADFIGTANFIRNKESYCAIRPEHVMVKEEQTEGSIKAIVEAVEFRGSSIRVYLNILDQTDMKTDHEFLIVDVLAEEIGRMRIAKDKVLYIKFRKERLLQY
ncbi:ATP-binding cassette domain-containing protein [Sporosarcina sp. CAU 1771]